MSEELEENACYNTCEQCAELGLRMQALREANSMLEEWLIDELNAAPRLRREESIGMFCLGLAAGLAFTIYLAPLAAWLITYLVQSWQTL